MNALNDISSSAPQKLVLAKVIALWKAESELCKILTKIAEAVPLQGNQRLVSRMHIHAAFCRGHAGRLLARSTNLGGPGPLLVPDEPEVSGFDDVDMALAFMQAIEKKYRSLTNLSRDVGDLSTAWVSEMNVNEIVDSIKDIRTLKLS